MTLPALREFRRLGACVAACLLAASAAPAADEAVPGGELVVRDDLLSLSIGVNYATLSGSEVRRADPGPGVEAGVGFRLHRNLSVIGSVAINKFDVNGQVTELLDQPVSPDLTSATVVGSIQSARVRAGIRVGALGQRSWRFHPYVGAAVVFSRNEVEINSVDGNPDPPQVVGPPPDFGGLVDIGSYSDNQIGGLARLGVEWGFSPFMALDANATYEVIEFPSGTNAITSINTLIVFRIS